MSPEPGTPSLASRPVRASDVADDARALIAHITAQLTLEAAARVLATTLARSLERPLAVLSRNGQTWQFEAEGFPAAATSQELTRVPIFETGLDPAQQWQPDSALPWTGIPLGRAGGRDWLLLAPGTTTEWETRPGFADLIERLGATLTQIARADEHEYTRRFGRKLHAFTQRLARDEDGRLHGLVLRTLASQVHARTAALAVYSEAERALSIVATHGYHSSLVEHIRIAPGEGIMGRVLQTGQPVVARADDDGGTRRLRYRTRSYMVLPIKAGRRRLAVLALTDRADGRDFSERDVASARMLAAASAPALMRERVSQRFDELTRMATVDSVTGLFNRNYFENRLIAEVERTRRQELDLALLMIDIDDFKRVNDTRGHLEGDRTLRDVADLLRQSVRIFDVCARFGGEEFAIVMPGASAIVATQVAERIRTRVERHFSHDLVRVTVSVGVGMLEPGSGSQELIANADHALMAAKAGGKNVVCVQDGPRSQTRQSP